MDRCTLASIALVLVPATAGAEVLNSGLQSEAVWTDNVFGTANDVVSDTSGRISPWADVADNEGRLTWGLRYAPSYEYYVDQSGLTGFDQDAGGRLAWQVGRTTLRISERFQQYHGISTFNEQAQPGQSIIPIGQRQLFDTNRVNASLDYQLGPQDLLSLSAYQSFYDYSDENLLDQSSFGSSLTFDHQLSERTSIGSSFSWSQQTVDRPNVQDSVTDYYNLSGVLNYAFSSTLHLALSAGPAFILSNANQIDPPAVQSGPLFPLVLKNDGYHFVDATKCPESSGVNYFDPATCGVFAGDPPLTSSQFNTVSHFQVPLSFVGAVPEVDDSTLTYFASMSLTKDWENWSGVFSYVRSQGKSTAIGSISDVLSFDLTWRIAPHWSADLAASYEQRQQATQNSVVGIVVENSTAEPPEGFSGAAVSQNRQAVVLDSGLGVDVTQLNFRLGYALTPRSSIYANANWRNEAQTGGVTLVDNASALFFTIGINHSFAPIAF